MWPYLPFPTDVPASKGSAADYTLNRLLAGNALGEIGNRPFQAFVQLNGGLPIQEFFSTFNVRLSLTRIVLWQRFVADLTRRSRHG